MRQKKLLLLLILIANNFIWSQDSQEPSNNNKRTYNISGKVLDTSSNPILGVSMLLLKTKDSAIVKYSISDETGFYNFNDISESNYILKTSHLAFKEYYGEVNLLNTNNTEVILNPIELEENVTSLSSVEVVGSKKIIQLKTDRIVFNVASAVTNVGEDALQTLKKAPGVSISASENIIYKGKGGVQILINGRSTQLSSEDLAGFLKSISASSIEEIELIDNPSAKFDASGTAGIINIKLKKNSNFGFNGNVSGNYRIGRTGKYDGLFTGNYRNEKVNLYGNYRYADDRYITFRTSKRESEDNLTAFDQTIKEGESKINHSYKFGIDYFLNEKNIVGFTFNGFNSKSDNDFLGETDIMSRQSGLVDSVLVSSNLIERERSNRNFNVNYSYSDTLGHSLSIDLNHVKFKRLEESFQPNTYFNPATNESVPAGTFFSNAPTNIKIEVGKIDYESNLFGGKIGLGGKISSISADNTFEFFEVENGIRTLLNEQSNIFIYHEDIFASYLNFKDEFPKWGYQFGIRNEHTSSNGELFSLNNVQNRNVDRDFTNFFPSASFSFTPNDSHSFNLAYSRRIQRPDYQSLNPFVVRIDNLTTSSGNPFLKPQLSNSVQITYAFKQYLVSSLSYLRTKDIIALIVDNSIDNEIRYFPENIAKGSNLNLSISSNLQVYNWWDIFVGLNGYLATYEGPINSVILDNSNFTFLVNGQSNFRLNSKVKAELSFFYRTLEVFGSFRNKAVGQINLGLQANILKDRGVLSMGINDLFNTLNLTSISEFGDLNVVTTQNPDSQIFKIGFSYILGSQKVKGSRSRDLGAEQEKNRF